MTDEKQTGAETEIETGAAADTVDTGPSGLRARALGYLRRSWPLALALVAFALGTLIGGEAPPPMPADHGHAAERDQIWSCAMHPQIRMQEPGQCPICGMDLVPISDAAGSPAAAAHARLSEHAKALARIRTQTVKRTEPRVEVRLLGHVEYDETRLRTVTPWTAGRIDRLSVRTTGTRIHRGQVVARLYSPEVYAAMRDLVLAAKQHEKLAKGMHGSRELAGSALEAARERLRLLGVPDAQITRVEEKRDAPKHVEVRSSFSGTVLERLVEEGDYVQAGTALFNLADLSHVWIQIDAYESDLPHIRTGQEVLVEVESLPDEPFTGQVAFIDPVVDRSKRTARVRVEVKNRDGQLRPGMFAEAVLVVDPAEKQSRLVIPSSAPLFTGRRSVVYVEVPGTEEPTYEMREVRLGPKAGPVYPVLAGLSEGERVVIEGAFVIDADLQLSGGRSMMTLSDDLERATPKLHVPVELRRTLKPVVGAYVRAQERLAADEVEPAREALAELADAVNAVEPSGPAQTQEVWRRLASELAGHARHASSSTAVGDMRNAFEHVSLQMESLLRGFGNPDDQPLRVAYCPMAFDSQGAAWIQRDGPVANPYYGASMLRCGDFRATVLPGEHLAAAGEPSGTTPAPVDHGH